MKDVREATTGIVSELLNFINAGIYLTDRDRTIVFWNRRAEEITGFRAEHVVGTRCRDDVLMHVDEAGNPLCSTEMCPLYRSMVTGTASPAPVLIYARTASGERIPVSTSVAPIHDEEGNVIGGVEVFQDERQNMRQMHLARTVLRTMLPQHLPAHERISFDRRYAPAAVIGGDFYHLARVSEGVFMAFVADIAGHGVSAALYVALMRSLVQECGAVQGDVVGFLCCLNERLFDRMPQVRLITAAAASFDVVRGELTYCGAGHPPALLQRAADGSVSLLESAGFPLAVEREAELSAVTVPMAPGDRLLLYTDGVTEIRTSDSTLLGVDCPASRPRGATTGWGSFTRRLWPGAPLRRSTTT